MRAKLKELGDLNKLYTALQSQKENLEQSLKRIEDSLNSEQGDLLQGKKNVTEFENKNRVLSAKVKELENKLAIDKEEIKRLDQKRAQLQQSLNETQELFDNTDKERGDLDKERNELLKKNYKN